MGVQVKWNWCNNYHQEEGNSSTNIYPIFPAYISSSSSNQHDCKHQIESLKIATEKSLPPPSVIPMCKPVAKQFVVAASLAQCGDVESNPGPKREPKPDKAKIMADKVTQLFFTYFLCWDTIQIVSSKNLSNTTSLPQKNITYKHI